MRQIGVAMGVSRVVTRVLVLVCATLAMWTLSTSDASALSAHGQLLRLAPHVRGNTSESSNWFGYDQGTLEQGSKLFNSIGGQWTVPTATQHVSGEAEYSSDWIGIGGGCVDASCTVTDSTLIQTGTEQDVSGYPPQASYYAWWEVIPGPAIEISTMTINPGDQMSASIAQVVGDADVWTITIKDLTDGQSYTSPTTIPYGSTMDTAEWIEETPLVLGTNAGFAALPDLTSPDFDLATVNGEPANLQPSEEIDLVDSNRNVIGAPSAPDPDNDGFNECTWASTCTAPTQSTGASITPTLPVDETPPAVTGAPVRGQTLSTTNGIWTGTSPQAYSYQWQDCDSAGNNCTAISGASGSSYTLAASDVGYTIRARVTASNQAGSASAGSVQTAPVQATPQIPNPITIPSPSSLVGQAECTLGVTCYQP